MEIEELNVHLMGIYIRLNSGLSILHTCKAAPRLLMEYKKQEGLIGKNELLKRLTKLLINR